MYDGSPGIPASIRERVFEQGAITADDGTESGLYILKQIADAHGWEVDVTESDTGARIEIIDIESPPTAEYILCIQ